MDRENKKMPFYVKEKHFEIYGPPLGIAKANFIKSLKCFIPKFVQHRIYNKFAEQTKKRMLQEDLLLFKIIHIETRTFCNGHCSFCPAAIQYKSRPDSYMPREIYSKIIDQLQKLNYGGRISPYCNNEPLIDERIYEFIEEARKKCPASHLEIKTNGKNLKAENLQLLIDLGVDTINITDYVNKKEFSPNIKEIIRAMLTNNLNFKSSKVIITWRRENEILQNRAGASPNAPPALVPLRRFCSRPFEMITVGTEGQIGICSSDFNFQHVLGNIKRMSVLEAWNSGEYQSIRKDMLRRDRACAVPCNKCDYRGYHSSDLKGHYRWVRWI